MQKKPVIPIVSAVASFAISALYLWLTAIMIWLAVSYGESGGDVLHAVAFLAFPVITFIAAILQCRREYSTKTIVGAVITPTSIAILLLLMNMTPKISVSGAGWDIVAIVYPYFALLYIGMPLSVAALIAVIAGIAISKRDSSLPTQQEPSDQLTTPANNPEKTDTPNELATNPDASATTGQTQAQPDSKGVMVLTVILAALIAIVFYFAYDMFTAAEMIQNGDTWMATAIAYAGFALVLSCGLILSSRTFAFRIPAAILLLSAGAVVCTTGEMMDAAQMNIHTNGTIGDGLSAGFAVLIWTACGTAMALIAIVIAATAGWASKNSNGTRKALAIVFAVVALLVAATPFAYARIDAGYLEPARGEQSLAEWKERNPYLSEQLEKRDLLEENGKNIVDGDTWYAGLSGGSWQLEYRGWEIRYDEEHDNWRAWTTPSEDLTIYVHEDAGYGITAYPDHEESKRIHVMVDRIDADTLATIERAVANQGLEQGNFKLEDGKLMPYAISAEQKQQAKDAYNDRGFPNDSTGGFSWTDDHDLQWTVYLRGDKSYASTYTMSDDHATVKHTVIVAQDPSYIRHGNDIDVIEVERVDAKTLSSKSTEARELLGR